MLLGFLGLVAYVFLVSRVIFHGFRIGSFAVTIAVLAVGLVAAIWWFVHCITKPVSRRLKQATAPRAKQAAAPAPQPRPASSDQVTVSFHVAGTTFANDDGTNRQDILRHLRFGDPPYADKPGDYTLSFREQTYKGDPAVAVLINGYQVGFVPKDTVYEVLSAMVSKSWSVTSLKITGGGTLDNGEKCNYGCAISIRF